MRAPVGGLREGNLASLLHRRTSRHWYEGRGCLALGQRERGHLGLRGFRESRLPLRVRSGAAIPHLAPRSGWCPSTLLPCHHVTSEVQGLDCPILLCIKGQP